jgi:RNase H-like domain found in reverse transcriptase
MQDDCPLACYSRKLNSAQKRYTTGEQELLSIVETLKEFKNILLGQKLIVHTDHKNLLYQKMSTARIIRWRLLIEDFGPTFRILKEKRMPSLMHCHDWMQTSTSHYLQSLQIKVWHISS